MIIPQTHKIVVFDLDETLGYWVTEFGILVDCIRDNIFKFEEI